MEVAPGWYQFDHLDDLESRACQGEGFALYRPMGQVEDCSGVVAI